MYPIEKSKTGNSKSEQSVKILKKTLKVPDKPRMICDDEQYQLLQDLIRQRLIECGWADQIKLVCKDILKEKGSEFTIPQLLEHISVKAKDMLPTSIKKELLQKVKEQMQKTRNNYPKKTKPTKSLSKNNY